MVLIRTLLVLFAVVASTTAASAADAWRVVASTGVVRAGGPGVLPVAVNEQQTLPADSWVETGATGRAVVTRGLESIVVSPNSRVLLPSQPVNGNTQVLQTLGSALYQIGKQKEPHFQVDTPYLAAVVKGTTFVITVSEGAASVDVTEGLVQVATPDGAHNVFVEPGFTAIVTRGQRDGVQVGPTANAPAQVPALDKNDATLKDSSVKGGAVIAAPIGEVSLDVKAASGGLVTAVEPAATAPMTRGLAVKESVTAAETTVGSLVSTEAAAVDTGVGVGVGAGGVAADAGVGAGVGGGVSAEVGVGVGTGSGGGVGIGLGVGGSSNGNGGGLGSGLGVGGSSNGNGGGLGLGLGLGLGNGNGGSSQ
jgi:hypothetical protein